MTPGIQEQCTVRSRRGGFVIRRIEAGAFGRLDRVRLVDGRGHDERKRPVDRHATCSDINIIFGHEHPDHTIPIERR
jgi:hypothetical protein